MSSKKAISLLLLVIVIIFISGVFLAFRYRTLNERLKLVTGSQYPIDPGIAVQIQNSDKVVKFIQPIFLSHYERNDRQYIKALISNKENTIAREIDILISDVQTDYYPLYLSRNEQQQDSTPRVVDKISEIKFGDQFQVSIITSDTLQKTTISAGEEMFCTTVLSIYCDYIKLGELPPIDFLNKMLANESKFELKALTISKELENEKSFN